MRRRDVIVWLVGAAVWPAVARGQQPAMRVIGWLSSGDRNASAYVADAFRRGLKDAGFIEGENVAIEYRWAEGQVDRVPELAADLVSRRVAVLVAYAPGAVAAKAITSTIPIVFGSGGDPVRLGLVSSLNRPGGNVTGVSYFQPLLEPKRLGLLHEMVPQVGNIGVLLNPSNIFHDVQLKGINEGASALRMELHVQYASNDREIDASLKAFVQARVGALLVAADPFFNTRRASIVAAVARRKVPAIYEWREFPDAGGLMSYGTSLTDSFRQVGVMTGQILQGAKPADLPVQQAAKFEFIINLTTAKALGITVPPSLLARADEVIE